MRYINTLDYNFIIQPSQLKQLLQLQSTDEIGTNVKLLRAENTAIEEIETHLVQRWDMDSEFTDTVVWVPGTYSAGDRVILTYPIWSATASYSINDCVNYSSKSWINLTGNNDAPGSNNWHLIGDSDMYYYAKNPTLYSLFNSKTYYDYGDKVIWDDHLWTCNIATHTLTNKEALQYDRIEWLPNSNVVPSDTNLTSHWIDGGTYSTTAYPNDEMKWIKGDNRNQSLVMYVMDMALYFLHKSISPTNIPDMRNKAYEKVCKDLVEASKGRITFNIREKQPNQGLKIRFSGSVRNNNSW